MAAKRFKDIRAVASECPVTHCQKPDDVGRYKGYEVKRSTTALNEVMHACNEHNDGYRVVRPQPHPPDLHSFVGTASKSGAVPPIKENRMQGHNGLNEINAPTKDNTPTRLKLS